MQNNQSGLHKEEVNQPEDAGPSSRTKVERSDSETETYRKKVKDKAQERLPRKGMINL